MWSINFHILHLAFPTYCSVAQRGKSCPVLSDPRVRRGVALAELLRSFMCSLSHSDYGCQCYCNWINNCLMLFDYVKILIRLMINS